MGLNVPDGLTPEAKAEGPKTPEYEFDIEETKVIGDTSKAVRFAGLVGILLGVVVSALGIGLLVYHLIAKHHAGTLDLVLCGLYVALGVVFAIIFAKFRESGTSLAAVALTEGNDVSHLLTAMRTMRKASSWQGGLLVVALGLFGFTTLISVLGAGLSAVSASPTEAEVAPPPKCPPPPVVVKPMDPVAGMVAVPAAAFSMGSAEGVGAAEEHPQHSVKLSAFYIDRTEVTGKDYAACVAKGACKAPGKGKRCNDAKRSR